MPVVPSGRELSIEAASNRLRIHQMKHPYGIPNEPPHSVRTALMYGGLGSNL
jgi:hypothetical protein